MNHGRQRIITTPKRWTSEELALLQSLRAAGISWADIAVRCGHSAASCCSTLSQLRHGRHKLVPDPDKPQRKINCRPWSDSDVRILLRMRNEEKRTFAEIDIALNRAEGASCGKWSMMRFQQATAMPDDFAPPPKVYHTSLTAELFGDPLPGRSALDQKRQSGAGGHPAPLPSASRSIPARDADVSFMDSAT